MKNNIGKTSKFLYIVSYSFLFSIASVYAQEEEMSASADHALCEGDWVTLSIDIDLETCTEYQLEWVKLMPDSTEFTLDGTDAEYQLNGEELLTRSEGTYVARTSCSDGAELEATVEVEQQMDDSKC